MLQIPFGVCSSPLLQGLGGRASTTIAVIERLYFACDVHRPKVPSRALGPHHQPPPRSRKHIRDVGSPMPKRRKHVLLYYIPTSRNVFPGSSDYPAHHARMLVVNSVGAYRKVSVSRSSISRRLQEEGLRWVLPHLQIMRSTQPKAYFDRYQALHHM